jgi:hypothetical protein
LDFFWIFNKTIVEPVVVIHKKYENNQILIQLTTLVHAGLDILNLSQHEKNIGQMFFHNMTSMGIKKGRILRTC